MNRSRFVTRYTYRVYALVHSSPRAAWSEREWNAVHTMAAQRGARTMAAHWTRS